MIQWQKLKGCFIVICTCKAVKCVTRAKVGACALEQGQTLRMTTHAQDTIYPHVLIRMRTNVILTTIFLCACVEVRCTYGCTEVNESASTPRFLTPLCGEVVTCRSKNCVLAGLKVDGRFFLSVIIILVAVLFATVCYFYYAFGVVE